jgi:hypothetical protein
MRVQRSKREVIIVFPYVGESRGKEERPVSPMRKFFEYDIVCHACDEYSPMQERRDKRRGMGKECYNRQEQPGADKSSQEQT